MPDFRVRPSTLSMYIPFDNADDLPQAAKRARKTPALLPIYCFYMTACGACMRP